MLEVMCFNKLGITWDGFDSSCLFPLWSLLNGSSRFRPICSCYLQLHAAVGIGGEMSY